MKTVAQVQIIMILSALLLSIHVKMETKSTRVSSLLPSSRTKLTDRKLGNDGVLSTGKTQPKPTSTQAPNTKDSKQVELITKIRSWLEKMSTTCPSSIVGPSNSTQEDIPLPEVVDRSEILKEHLDIKERQDGGFTAHIENETQYTTLVIKNPDIFQDPKLSSVVKKKYICPMLNDLHDDIAMDDLEGFVKKIFEEGFDGKKFEGKGRYIEDIPIPHDRESRTIKLILKYSTKKVVEERRKGKLERWQVHIHSNNYSSYFTVKVMTRDYITKRIKEIFMDVYDHGRRGVLLDVGKLDITNWMINCGDFATVIKIINTKYELLDKDKVDSLVEESFINLETPVEVQVIDGGMLKFHCGMLTMRRSPPGPNGEITEACNMMTARASYEFSPEGYKGTKRTIMMKNTFLSDTLYNINMLVEGFVDDVYTRIGRTMKQFRRKFKSLESQQTLRR